MDSRPLGYGKTVCPAGREVHLDYCNALSQNTARQGSKVGGTRSPIYWSKVKPAMKLKS